MPTDFTRTMNVVKRNGGASAIADSYKYDLQSNRRIISSELINGDPNEIILKLRIDDNSILLTTTPILIDDDAKKNYLIEGYLQQREHKGKFFRCRIKNAIKILDDRYGLLLQVTCEGVEIRMKETPLSHALRTATPAYALTKYIIDYNSQIKSSSVQEKLYGQGTILNGKVITSNTTTVLLNDTPTLKQDWRPGGVRTFYDMFDVIIKKLSLAQPQGGTNVEYYMDYEYPHDNSFTNDKEYIKVISGIFGNVDSGIIINPKSFSNPEIESSEIVDNTKYYDHVILECDSLSASIPMDRTRYFSQLDHAKLRDEYSASVTYAKDDLVKATFQSSRTVKFYKSKINNNTIALPTGTSSPQSNAGWIEDFVRDNKYSPLTNNLEIWKANLSAYGYSELATGLIETPTSVTVTSGYIGGFVDPNFVRPNYDRGDLDYYHTITLKDVTRIAIDNSGIPTGDAVYDGQRILVGNNKNVNITTTPFASNKQRLAEYDALESSWKFSKDPEAGDVISDHSTMKLYKYVGVYPNGNWDILWNINSGGGWQTSPFHPVKSMKLADDVHGVANAAVEFLFDWNTDLITGGDSRNRYSRGYWLSFYNPTPRRYVSANYPIGEIFSAPFQDTENLQASSLGEIGYNGIHAEDHGPINGIRFTITATIEDSGNKILDFKANQKVTFCVRDKFDRIHFIDDVIPGNGKPHTFILAYGYGGGQNLWVNRVDDLKEIYGLTIPAFFGLSEEENSGITFDWNFVKSWGFFYSDPYSDEPRYYIGGADSYIDDLAGRLSVVYEYFLNAAQSLFTPSEKGAAIVLADHAKLRIEDLHYIKQLIVSSSDVTSTNPHFKVLQEQNERDYENAKLTARSYAAKGKAFRPIRHITSELDVRLKKGQQFKTADNRSWVVLEVKQIINDDGAIMQIAAIPKLIIGV